MRLAEPLAAIRERDVHTALVHGVDLPDVLGELRAARPAWMADALCREYPEVDFHPENSAGVREAEKVCARCLVRAPCLLYALETGQRDGVWGGISARRRRRLSRRS